MVTRDLLLDLVRHMEWADARVWAALPPQSADDPRLYTWLKHIHTVQHAFLAIWQRADVNAALGRTEGMTLPGVREWARDYYPRATAFLSAATDDELAQPVEMPWAAQIATFLGHPPGPTTLAETGIQIASHSTYHRGQVNARLRELGGEPPLVDYIAWLWAKRPAPEWPR